MAEQLDRIPRTKSSPKPPEHANTFDPVTIKAPFSGPRTAVPSPLSRDVDEGNRRRGPSFLGVAASPAALRADAGSGSMENFSGERTSEEAESAASTATLVESRPIHPIGGGDGGDGSGRPLSAGPYRIRQRNSLSRLRGEAGKEGMSDVEDGLEEGLAGGGVSGKQAGRIKKRRIFTRADPKSYFSNERTMYSWMYLNLLTLSYSFSLYAYPRFSGENPGTDTAATFASGVALILVICSAIRFGLRQDRLAGTENWMTKLSRRRFRGRRNTVVVHEEGGELVRQADVFDDHVYGYPLIVTMLIIAVLTVNIVFIYHTPAYKPHRMRTFTA